MKSILLVICCSAAMSWTAPACSAHGMDGSVARAEGYCVAVAYDDGEPGSYAAVEIKAPNSELVFQKGRTDRNGRFIFRPDAPGPWQAIVQDGMGHRLVLDVLVGESTETPGKAGAGTQLTGAAPGRLRNMFTGLAIIFGLCGLFYGRRGRSPSGSVLRHD